MKENAAHYSCTVHDAVTVPYAMRFHGLDAILDRSGTLCVFSFSRPGAGIYFVTVVHIWNACDFLFTTGLFTVFLS